MTDPDTIRAPLTVPQSWFLAERQGRRAAEARIRTLEDALERTKDGAETPESDAQHEPGRATAVELGAVLFAADALAENYGRIWAKDEKYYAYMDARAALAAAETEKP